MKRFLLPAIILSLLAGSYTFLCFTVDTERTLPRTAVNDTDISNMTLTEATDALKKESEDRQKASIFTVSYADADYTLSIGSALKLDYEAAARDAIEESKTSFFARGFAWIRSQLTGNQIQSPRIAEDTDTFHQILADSGILDKNAVNPDSYTIEDKQLRITTGIAKKADEKALKQEMIAAIQTQDYESVKECPLTADEEHNLEKIYGKIHTDPVNATLDPNNDYAVVDSVTGVDFDKEKAKKALTEAQPGDTVTIDLVYTEPEITTQDLKNHLFKDTLSTYTTKVGGSSNKIVNIDLAVAKCNGIILLPDEIFSFNNTVGIQTAETGFKTADAILDGKIIQAYGGGICQVSSTIFAAALYANLDIVERWNHDYVSNYIDAGMDAAVAWDALDFRIANDTPYPVKMQVEHSGANLTVTLLGTKTDDSVIEIKTKTIPNPDNHLLEVETYRNVYTEDRSQLFIDRVTHSIYVKSQTID